MDNNWGNWYRSAGVNPTNDLLQNRDNGIISYLKNDITVEDAISLLRLFYNIPVSDEDVESFYNAIYENDKAFDRSNKNEISVLAGIVLFEICTKNKNGLNNFVFSSMHTIGFNNVLITVPDIQKKILESAYQSQLELRKNILTDHCQFTFPSYKNVEKAYKDPANANVWNPALATASLTYFNEIQKSFSEVFNHLSTSYKDNSILFEDSQILWWITGKWSNDFKKPFAAIDYKALSIYSGKELADLVSVLPGPYSAKAVLDVVLQENKEKTVNIFDTVFSLDESWKIDVLKAYNAENLIEITPMLYTIYKSCELDDRTVLLNSLNKKLPQADIFQKEYSLLDVAFQIYNECLVIKARGEHR
ncbi:hypothetical protein AGMMS49942_29200 [Spirochaetia bacterium]|nr:hypothetical protein AGMMS49942_29200 [Spirochaetia bacterium]